MFSRDDTPGEIAPYYGIKSRDDPKYIPIQIEKVPHLARLFEETLGLNELLLPEGTAGAPKFAQNEEGNGPLIASAENNVLGQETRAESCSSKVTNSETEKVLGEKTILAQDNENQPVNTSITLTQQGCIVRPLVQVETCQGGGNAYRPVIHCGYKSGKPEIVMPRHFFDYCGPNCWIGDPQCPGIDLSNMKVGDSASTSIFIEMFDVEHCAGARDLYLNCTVTKNGPECGQFEATCETGAPVEELCGIAGPSPVSDCFSEAIKDSNPNDKICGEPKECDKYQAIEFPFTAWDAFQNHLYLECGTTGEYSCKPVEVIPGEPPEYVCKDHCYDEITQEVNRRFGINLIHPYLNEIWNLSTNNETFGIFNIFRPAQIPPFEDIDASSEISYSYIDTSLPPGGSVTPETGEFYFNHLGGVQKAKEWVTTKVLMPYVEQ